MDKRTLRIELSNDNFIFYSSYYAELELPAKDYEIQDALQRLRAVGLADTALSISVLECPALPELADVRLDSPTLAELNFFANRLAMLDSNQKAVLTAVARGYIHLGEEDELVSMKDLINMTYGLDDVPVASNISTDEQLGQLVIENDMNEDVAAIPEQSLYLLDRRQIGKLQRESDGGIFVGNRYVAAGEYEMPEVYDGEHLPETEPDERYAFALLVSGAPANKEDVPGDLAEWIYLPIDRTEADRIAMGCGMERIEECVFLDFKSTIPQITEEQFGDMQDFDKLNMLSGIVMQMPSINQAKFKAAMSAECPADMDAVLDIAEHLREYETNYFPDDEGAFFREYLRYHLDTKFDSAWLDTLLTQNEGTRLLQRLGAAVTDYGAISARGRSLYELVPYNEPQNKELTAQSLTDEKLEVVEVLGQTALFTNGRVTEQELPEGLYCYDLREGESVSFATIEPHVVVNHAGTILMKSPLDFGGREYITLDDETSPNFLGESMSMQEFMDADFTQSEDAEEQQMGGMQL